MYLGEPQTRDARGPQKENKKQEYVRSVDIPCASLMAPSFSLSVSAFILNGWGLCFFFYSRPRVDIHKPKYTTYDCSCAVTLMSNVSSTQKLTFTGEENQTRQGTSDISGQMRHKAQSQCTDMILENQLCVSLLLRKRNVRRQNSYERMENIIVTLTRAQQPLKNKEGSNILFFLF